MHGRFPLGGRSTNHNPRRWLQEPSVSCNSLIKISDFAVASSKYIYRGTGHASQEEISQWVKKELEGGWQSKG